MPLALLRFLFLLLFDFHLKSLLGKGAAAMADKLSGNIYFQDASCKELMPREQGHGSLTVTYLSRWKR